MQELVIDRTRAVVVGMGPYLLHIWSIRGGGELVARRSVEYPENTIRDFALDATGDVLAYLVTGIRNEVVFVDVVTGARLDIVSGGPAGSGQRRGDGSWQLNEHLADGLLPRRVAIGHSTDRRLDGVAVALGAGKVLYWSVGEAAPVSMSTGLVRLDAIMVTPDGGVRWAGPGGWGERSADGDIARYDLAVPDDLGISNVVGPTFVGNDLVYTVEAESAVELRRMRATRTDAVVRLSPDAENRMWSDERAPVADPPYPSPPRFVGLSGGRTHLELYDDGLANVRDDETGDVLTFRLAGRTADGRVDSVGVEVDAREEGWSPALVATARGSVVSVYELAALERVRPAPMGFFITSTGLGDGANLGGLEGADAHCQSLAAAVGAGDRTWRAYLSTQGPGAVNARDRIGKDLGRTPRASSWPPASRPALRQLELQLDPLAGRKRQPARITHRRRP